MSLCRAHSHDIGLNRELAIMSAQGINILVKQMNIGMQVSLTETFNIVAADFVYNNIPFIGSESILWLPERFQVKDPNSTDEILEKLNYVDSWFGWWFKNSAVKSLNRYNKEAKKVWDNFIL
jgi:hypothetical protein